VGFRILGAALSAAIAIAPLHAQSSTFSGAVALSSQLVDRGLAITPVTPVLQGDVAWNPASGWTLGLAAASQARAFGHASEALAQAAHLWTLADDWRMQAGLLYYSYPGNTRAGAFDRVEGGASWMYRDVLSLGLSAITLTHGSRQQPRGAADVDARWPLPRRFALSAGLGVAQPLVTRYGMEEYDRFGRYARTNSYYGYGHLGLDWSRGAWRIELDRVFTDPSIRQTGMAAAPWVATIAWSF
jgi:uncharacterized protein (TIGR02001 family)